MLPDFSLSGMLKQAKGRGEPGGAEEAQYDPVARDLPETAQPPRKRRSPRPKPVVDRSEASPRTVWLSPATWDRVKLQAVRKRMSASEVVEMALVGALPDLVVQERAA